MPRTQQPEIRVVTGVGPHERSRRQVADAFRSLLAKGMPLRAVGQARRDPVAMLLPRYTPRHAVSLFDVIYYLTDFLFEEGLNFYVAFLVKRRAIYPRIFYKDSSLIWRVASHVIRTNGEDWIGKGDVRWVRDGDSEHLESDEDTTNLPYEIQAALDTVSRRRKPRRDDDAIRMVLHNAPEGRIRPYADFSAPRRRAAAAHALNRGRPVARITRRADPRSLRFAPGFDPDFAGGLLETTRSGSRLYGGEVRKFRILSRNRRVQYQFVASPSHVWVNPPQALTTEITSYGVRALHVPADEEVFVPGYEYHLYDREVDPPVLYSQIPEGWAGPPSAIDPERADASPWIERLPVIRQFRKRIL